MHFLPGLQPNNTIFGWIKTMSQLIYIRLFNEYLFCWELKYTRCPNSTNILSTRL